MSLLVIGPGVHIHLCRGQAGAGVRAGAVIRPCGNIGRKGVAAAHRAGIAAGIGRRYRHIEHRTARAAGLTCSAPRDVGTRADWQAIVKGSGECQASGDRDGRMQNRPSSASSCWTLTVPALLPTQARPRAQPMLHPSIPSVQSRGPHLPPFCQDGLFRPSFVDTKL